MSPHSIITGTILDSIRNCQSAIELSSRLDRYKCATKHFVSQSIQFVAGFLRALENHLSTNTKMEACVGRPTDCLAGGHSIEFFLEINSAGHRLASLVFWHVSSRCLVCTSWYIHGKNWNCIPLIPFGIAQSCLQSPPFKSVFIPICSQSSLPTVTLAAAVAHVRKRRKKTWCWPQLLRPFQISSFNVSAACPCRGA